MAWFFSPQGTLCYGHCLTFKRAWASPFVPELFVVLQMCMKFYNSNLLHICSPPSAPAGYLPPRRPDRPALPASVYLRVVTWPTLANEMRKNVCCGTSRELTGMDSASLPSFPTFNRDAIVGVVAAMLKSRDHKTWGEKPWYQKRQSGRTELGAQILSWSQCRGSLCAALHRSAVSDSSRHHGLQPARLLCPWDSPGKNTGVGCHALLQGIFPTQRSNPGLPHCGRIFYQLSHQGSPRILGWVAFPFSRGPSPPRNRAGVSCIAADSLPAEIPGKSKGL